MAAPKATRKRGVPKPPSRWIKSIIGTKPSIENTEKIIAGLQEYVDNFKQHEIEALQLEIDKINEKISKLKGE